MVRGVDFSSTAVSRRSGSIPSGLRLLDWCSGYHVCFTRSRSPVRARYPVESVGESARGHAGHASFPHSQGGLRQGRREGHRPRVGARRAHREGPVPERVPVSEGYGALRRGRGHARGRVRVLRRQGAAGGRQRAAAESDPRGYGRVQRRGQARARAASASLQSDRLAQR